ncbi:hypothetical protein [Gordonia oryzae]|uniref:hypothetical protein n=1 Tax=Gordonia oryzae TaxID=2487349 RepID=UPI001FEC4477|nr:hypothetical protein [Gordonia oryzae]
MTARAINGQTDLVTAIVSMRPPAWECDPTLPDRVQAMFEYFLPYGENNDGRAAVIFGDSPIIDATGRSRSAVAVHVEPTDDLCAFADPMHADGVEQVPATGVGNAINPLTDVEGNVSRFFSR